MFLFLEIYIVLRVTTSSGTQAAVVLIRVSKLLVGNVVFWSVCTIQFLSLKVVNLK